MIRQIVETSTPSLSDPHKFIHSLIRTTMAAIATKFALWEVLNIPAVFKDEENNKKRLNEVIFFIEGGLMQ